MDESLLQHLLQRPIDPEKQPSDASLAQNTPLLPAVVNIEPNVQTENSTFEYDEHIRPSNLRQRIKRTPVGILNLQQRTKRINLSLKQGIKRFFDKAVEAAAMEITQIIAKKVYKYVHSSNGKTAMQSHMLINEKLAPSGNLVKIKGIWKNPKIRALAKRSIPDPRIFRSPCHAKNCSHRASSHLGNRYHRRLSTCFHGL